MLLKKSFEIRSAAAAGLLALAAAAAASCNKTATITPSEPSAAGAGAETGDLASRGRVVYKTTCTACHNADPKKAGALGPEVWGSSLELLEARILRAEYPTGYKPKRATTTMQPLPQVKADIQALHAYLNGR